LALVWSEIHGWHVVDDEPKPQYTEYGTEIPKPKDTTHPFRKYWDGD